MDRRSALKSSLLAIAGVGIAGFADAAMISSSGEISKEQEEVTGVFFSHGVLASQTPDGSWNLWVRAVARGKNPDEFVKLRLEVATDPAFSDIVDTWRYVAYRKKSYILRTNYSPKEKSAALYFRFVQEADATKTKVKAVEPKTSPVGTLESRAN